MINTNIQPGDNKAFNPSAMSIDAIEITNHAGQSKFIQNLVVKFELVESLYSPVLQLKLGIKDALNFIEKFPIIGQETINILLSRNTLEQGTQEIQLPFQVKKYPTFAKPAGENVQVYTIEAISPHGYRSLFKKISRSFKEPAESEIGRIIKEDLEFESNYNVFGNDTSKSRGLINIQTPLQAAEFFRKIAYDENGAPFFLYQAATGDINFTSFSQLFDDKTNPIYNTYVDARNFTKKFQNDESEDYAERSKRILEVASNLNLSKYEQSRTGAFASQNNFLDWSDKSYTRFEFDYDANISATMEPNKVLSSDTEIFAEPLNKLPHQHCEYISVNKLAYGDDLDYGFVKSENIAQTNAYHSLLNTYTHDIKLFGDFNLTPGRKIELKFPKSVDPEEKKALTGDDDNDLFDNSLSGKYLITSVIHTIEGGEYYSDVRVKRDSFSISI